jgi:DNA-binding beta-propeller fold protein YncE
MIPSPIRLTAVSLAAGLLVLASVARAGGEAPIALRQLPGTKGCWVGEAGAGCSVYRLPPTDSQVGLFGVVATVVSPDGRNVYAASNPYTNLIVAFARARDGSLVRVAGRGGCIMPRTSRCEPPVYRQREISSLAVSRDGRRLYSTADYRYVQAVQAIVRVAGGGLRGAAHGISCDGVRRGVQQRDRRNRCRVATTLGNPPRELAPSPDGRDLYLVADGGVIGLRRTPSGGIYPVSCLALPGQRLRDAPCAPARATEHAAGVAVSPDGRNVYVASADGLAIFARNAATGGLTQLAGPAGCIAESAAAGCAIGRAVARPSDVARSGGSRVAISRDGRDVYLAAADEIASFARDARSGALTQLAGPAGCVTQSVRADCSTGRSLSGIEGLAVSPDGRAVYAAARASRALALLRRLPNGALSQPADATGCHNADGSGGCTAARAVGAARGVSVSPDSRSVYVASDDRAAGLAVFARR